MDPRAARAELLAPRVRFEPGFVRRLERLGARVALARELREGAGRGALSGAGEAFVGHRPYRPGEDLRHLDWSLLARLDQLHVRVHRREASESWSLCVDTSASMGLGAPGKLQQAAELAAGIGWLGLRHGARVELFAGAARGSGASWRGSRRPALGGLLATLGGLRAEGSAEVGGLPAQLARRRRAGARCGRLFLIGDLLDLPPETLQRALGGARALHVVQVLAPHELAADALPDGARVEWVDPEGGAPARVLLDGAARARYARALEARLEQWQRALARRRAGYRLQPSSAPFEEGVRAALAG